MGSMNKELKELIIKIVGSIILVTLVLVFVVGVHVNHTNDMVPALKDGDLIITYKLDKQMYSSLAIAYKNPNGKTQYGRVIGVPGDEINITEEGNYTINNNVTMENIYYNTFPGENIEYPYTVPENSYFIMNDYRDNINDSRTYGAINIKDIEGPVFLDLRRRGF